MRSYLKGMALGAAVVLGFAGAALAADEAGKEAGGAVKMKEEVVVAQPIIEGNQVTRYGGTKTIVGADQVSDLNAQDVTSALRTTPGVTISRYNPIGSFGGGEGGAVYIRGMGGGRPGGEIKTTMDGVNLGNPIYNHGLMDLMPVSPAGSIEVIKGVQPTEMGSGFGGVNVVPKRMTQEGYKTTVGTSYGSFNTFTENIEHGGKQGDFDYYLGQSWKRSDGHRDKSDGSLKDAFASLGYQLNRNWEIKAFGLGSDNYAADPGNRYVTNPRDELYKTTNTMGTLTLANTYGMASGEFKIYLSHVEAKWYDQVNNAKDTLMHGDSMGFKAKEALNLWQGGEILLGMDFDRVTGRQSASFDNNTPPLSTFGNKYTTLSPRAAVSQMFGDKSGYYLIPSVGARYFDNTLYGSDWAPHAGLVGGYKDTELHLSVARGVNYPGLEVLAMGRNGAALKPEILDHVEVGVAQKFSDTVKADLNLFQDRGSNRYAMTGGAWTNDGNRYEVQGAEATLNWNPTKTLALYASGTWLNPTPSDLPYTPEWTWAAGGNWLFAKNFKLSADAQYVDSMHALTRGRGSLTPSNSLKVVQYFLLNAKLSYLLDAGTLGAKGGEIYLAGDNLTSSNYCTRPDYPMPGVGVTVGMNLTF